MLEKVKSLRNANRILKHRKETGSDNEDIKCTKCADSYIEADNKDENLSKKACSKCSCKKCHSLPCGHFICIDCITVYSLVQLHSMIQESIEKKEILVKCALCSMDIPDNITNKSILWTEYTAIVGEIMMAQFV